MGDVRIRRPPRNRKGVTVSEIEQELSWRKWFPDIVWRPEDFQAGEVEALVDAFCSFCEANIVIRHPSHGKIPFRLRSAQREVITEWISSRKVVNLKARQIGFTTLIAAFSLWICLGWDDKNIIILSKGQREANRLLAMAKLGYRQMPEWVKRRAPARTNNSAESMTFANDSMLQSLPSGNEPARGDSAFLIIVDEWAFLNDPDAAWSAVEPVADIGGRIIGISTAKGEGNFFHQLWLAAEAGENGFVPIFFPWSAVPERDAAWYDRKKRELRDKLWLLHQEYPSTAEEAFVGSGNPVFDLERLYEMVTRKPLLRLHIESSGEGHGFLQYPSQDGDLWVYEEPQPGKSYAIGADTAQGLEHGGWTVCWVIEVESGEPVAVYRAKVDPDVLGEKILPGIGYYYNWAVVGPEVNNHGLTTLRALQRVKYGRLYRRRTMAKRQEKIVDTVGWLTTMATKPYMIDELAKWLREHDIPHASTLQELKTFTRDSNGKMEGSPHDDCVMALAVAVQVWTYAVRHPQTVREMEVPGSFAQIERMLAAQERNNASIRRMTPNMSRSRQGGPASAPVLGPKRYPKVAGVRNNPVVRT
jgi:hypothetical protein